MRDPKTPSSKNAHGALALLGTKPIWDSQTSIHNQMMDEKGRVWAAARVRPIRQSRLLQEGSQIIPRPKVFPLQNRGRHLSMYDPATDKFTLISTCFPTHHLKFAEDANNTLWVSSGVTGPGAFGWLNRKMFEETGDEVRSQGWSPFILDTNGNGKRDEYVEPSQPADPAKDTRDRRESLRGGGQSDGRRGLGHRSWAIPAASCAWRRARPHAHLARRNL